MRKSNQVILLNIVSIILFLTAIFSSNLFFLWGGLLLLLIGLVLDNSKPVTKQNPSKR